MSSPTPPIPTSSPEAPLVLIIEDEGALAETIAYSLKQEGMRAVIAPEGEEGVQLFRSQQPALVLLDLMLPKLSGLDVCRIIRSESTVPIVILTAKDSEADKVAGLELGADDYVTKPFSMRELVSRVRANLRRADMNVPGRDGPGGDSRLVGGPIVLDPETHEVFVHDRVVPFTPKEFDLLEVLLSRKGRLLTRDHLIAEVWGPDYFGDTKTLDVHVKRIRQKIEPDPHHPKLLLTVRGLGYKFSD